MRGNQGSAVRSGFPAPEKPQEGLEARRPMEIWTKIGGAHAQSTNTKEDEGVSCATIHD